MTIDEILKDIMDYIEQTATHEREIAITEKFHEECRKGDKEACDERDVMKTVVEDKAKELYELKDRIERGIRKL